MTVWLRRLPPGSGLKAELLDMLKILIVCRLNFHTWDNWILSEQPFKAYKVRFCMQCGAAQVLQVKKQQIESIPESTFNEQLSTAVLDRYKRTKEAS